MVTYCPYCMSPASSGQLCSNCGADPASYHPSSHHFPMGQLLHDRYLVGKVLGEGGFGITYLGLDTKLERRVAIKEYFPNVFVHRESSISLDVTCYTGENQTLYEKGRDQFLQEARVIAQFDTYPEIVHVHDYFPANNTAYIVMELLIGNTLHTVLAQQKRIPAKYLFEIMEPVLRTMNAMHGAGIIHRDISPDNFMLLDNGQLKLLDFGCARDVDKEHTMTVMLKHGYAPMEQYTGYNQGPWTDVYALCATLYHCLTGEIPPKALERLSAQDDPLIPPNHQGAALTLEQEQALIRGLAVEPKNRWQSIAGLYAELYGTVISNFPSSLPSQPNGPKPKPPAGPPTEPADPPIGSEPGLKPDPRPEPTPGPKPKPRPEPEKKGIFQLLAQNKKLLVGIAAGFLVFLIIFVNFEKNDASSADLPPSPTVSEQNTEAPQDTGEPQDTEKPQNTEEPQSTPTPTPTPAPTLTPTPAPTPTPTPTLAPSVSSIALSQNTLNIKAGQSASLSAYISPSNATGYPVIWSSSDPSVVTVDSNGNVSTVHSGHATITASCGGKAASCAVMCYVPMSEISFWSGADQLSGNWYISSVGQHHLIAAGAHDSSYDRYCYGDEYCYEWELEHSTISAKSSNTSCISIDSIDGIFIRFTCHTPGEATITVIYETSFGGRIQKSIHITVN